MKVKFFFLFVSMSFFITSASAIATRIGLKQAIDNDMVSIKATATGNGFNKKGLHLQLENKSGSALQVTMDIGMILQPSDTMQQDLVLAGEEMIALAPYKTGALDVQTFCAKSYAGAPSSNQDFHFLKMGDKQLTDVLRYIKNNRLFDDLGQHAVWAMTNYKNLSGVYDPARDLVSRKLLEYMILVTGWENPEYFAVSKISNQPGLPVIQPKTLKIYAQFEEKLDAPKTLTLGVFNEEGKMVQPVFENRIFGKGGSRWRVEFEAGGVEAGKYYIRLKEGEAVLKEKMVLVE